MYSVLYQWNKTLAIASVVLYKNKGPAPFKPYRPYQLIKAELFICNIYLYLIIYINVLCKYKCSGLLWFVLRRARKLENWIKLNWYGTLELKDKSLILLFFCEEIFGDFDVAEKNSK